MLQRTSDTRTNGERTFVERTIDVVPFFGHQKTNNDNCLFHSQTIIRVKIYLHDINGFQLTRHVLGIQSYTWYLGI